MSEALTSVATDRAPAAVGPYSQAVVAGNLVFVSGQIPLHPNTGQLVEGGFEAQVEQVLSNLDAILTAAGCDRTRVAKVTVYLTDLSRFGAMNAVYERYFGQHRPARATVEVAALPRGAAVEIEAVAVR
jgi:2-iminobutanoate/2-iminopropanoate deaminase